MQSRVAQDALGQFRQREVVVPLADHVLHCFPLGDQHLSLGSLSRKLGGVSKALALESVFMQIPA